MKEGLNVKGLTTAATIWVNAGIGAAIGMGEYMIGLSALVITVIVLSVFAFIEKVLHLKPTGGTLEIRMTKGRRSTMDIMGYLDRKGVLIRSTEIRSGPKCDIMILDVDLKRRSRIFSIIDDINGMQDINEIRWDDSELRRSSGPFNLI
jgi:putative Mg2+ transporter-C (MgtC) family protein